MDKQGKKADARDVVPYLKTVFSNARGEGLWGQGVHAINLYLRSYLDEFDVERAYREEFCDTGGLSASGNPYWEVPSKWNDWAATKIPGSVQLLADQGYGPSVPSYATGVSREYLPVIEHIRAYGPAVPARPMDPSKDAAIVFWGVNEVVEYDTHGNRAVRHTENWPRGLRAQMTELCFTIKQFPRSVVVLGNHSTSTCSG